MSDIKDKLNDLKESIAISDDSLAPIRDMLASAETAANGSQDKIQSMSEALGHMAFVVGRLAIRETACPMRGVVGGKLAYVYPFRWPLALVASVAMLVMGGDRIYDLLAEKLSSLDCAQYVPN